MVKGNIYRRILFIGAGLVIIAAVLLTLLVIPCIIFDKSPQAEPVGAVFGTLIVVMLHVTVLYAFREAIIVTKRNGHLKNIIFVVTGTGLLLLGLFIMDGAFAFQKHVHMQLASITMFICIGCDFIAAVMAFTALFFQPGKMVVK